MSQGFVSQAVHAKGFEGHVTGGLSHKQFSTQRALRDMSQGFVSQTVHTKGFEGHVTGGLSRKHFTQRALRDLSQGLVPQTVYTKGFKRDVTGACPTNRSHKGARPTKSNQIECWDKLKGPSLQLDFLTTWRAAMKTYQVPCV